jgi:hypothetical protein
MVISIYPSLAHFVKPLSVPIDDDEALFSLWQESKRKDIERFFGVFKKFFNLFANPIKLFFLRDIINACYCCLILHNMAVMERIEMDDGVTESDVVADDEHVGNCNTRENAEALRFVQMQEQHVSERALEVEFLSTLGINIHDSMLPLDLQCVRVLPQLTRFEEFRWSRLYDVNAHKRLTAAIARELSQKYKEAHNRHDLIINSHLN